MSDLGIKINKFHKSVVKFTISISCGLGIKDLRKIQKGIATKMQRHEGSRRPDLLYQTLCET